jgi:hypothetical protein
MFRRTHILLVATLLASASSAYAAGEDDARDLLCTDAYARSMRSKTMFEKIDANGDGQVTHDEIVVYFTTMFDALDIDHNGVLDDQEWLGARTSVPVIKLSSGGYAKQLATDRMMRLMDRQNHKVVTREDFIAQHEKIFDAMRDSKSETLDSHQWLAAHFPK